MEERQTAAARDGAGQQIRLIEPALPFAPPVQRNGHHAIEALIARQGRRQQIAERPGQRLHSIVFIEVDELPQRAFVGAETVGPIEAAQSGPAKRAASLSVYGAQPPALLRF